MDTSDSDPPRLLVVPLSDAFAGVWPDLARQVGAVAQVDAPAAVERARADDAVCVLLIAAGVEAAAAAAVRDLRAQVAVPIVAIGAEADHRLAAALVRSGAADYFALPADLESLRGELQDRVRRFAARRAGSRHAVAERAAFDFRHIIGQSAALRTALERAARIIPRDRATVLVTGETGTGKELLAQAIHYNGPRAAQSFVEVNCTAIPSHLLEAELFGYERGAFTDARTAKPGLFEVAHRGTLFLDEVGHLPYELQGKILKAIEEKTVRRLGGLRSREIDVRIIAATHVDLAQAVREHRFREDLFYRLNVIPIHLPPLRERGDDVLLLAEFFLRTLAEQYELPVPKISAELRGALLGYGWPGNVRELRNGLERALLLSEGAIDPADLLPAAPGEPTAEAEPNGGPIPFPAAMDEIERSAARRMTELMQGNKSAAAEALGISRSRLYRLLDDAPDAK